MASWVGRTQHSRVPGPGVWRSWCRDMSSSQSSFDFRSAGLSLLTGLLLSCGSDSQPESSCKNLCRRLAQRCPGFSQSSCEQSACVRVLPPNCHLVLDEVTCSELKNPPQFEACAAPACTQAGASCNGSTFRICAADCNGSLRSVEYDCATLCSLKGLPYTGTCGNSYENYGITSGQPACWCTQSQPLAVQDPFTCKSTGGNVGTGTGGRAGVGGSQSVGGLPSAGGPSHTGGAKTICGNAVSAGQAYMANAVATGSGQSCALVTDGTVQCWGLNLAISVGRGFACAALGDGAVQCWGDNYPSGLGNGSKTVSSVPMAVVGISNAVAVSAGNRQACAVLAQGAIECWGNNWYGQLGNNTTADSLVPVDVTLF